jgi:hypothetical protein
MRREKLIIRVVSNKIRFIWGILRRPHARFADKNWRLPTPAGRHYIPSPMGYWIFPKSIPSF